MVQENNATSRGTQLYKPGARIHPGLFGFNEDARFSRLSRSLRKN